MSNLFIKYPTNTRNQEAIVNLQNVKYIQKNDYVSVSSWLYTINFHTAYNDYFSYVSKDKKTRDDFFEAILQKLSLNN